MRTKVFISQSGERSKRMAAALKDFVSLLTHTEPWTSDEIPKGDGWPNALAAELAAAAAGMACLTPESQSNPWIHYEVGALARTPATKVWTVLMDLEPTAVAPPLGWRQHTEVTDKADVFLMIEGINETTGDDRRKPDDLRRGFEVLWPRFEGSIAEIQAIPTHVPEQRDEREVLNEILSMVRGLSSKSWQADKSLRMMHLIYEGLFREKAPAMADMASPEQRQEIARRLSALAGDGEIVARTFRALVLGQAEGKEKASSDQSKEAVGHGDPSERT